MENKDVQSLRDLWHNQKLQVPEGEAEGSEKLLQEIRTEMS